MDELETVAPGLRNMPAVAPYSVPTGYFESLAQIVLTRVGNNPQTDAVPEGYFNSFPDTMLAKVRSLEVANELEAVAPLLNSISKQPVYQVPDGYFDTLQATPPVQVGKAPIRSIASRVWPYAVAACLAAAVWFGAQWNAPGPQKQEPALASQTNVDTALANIDAEAIQLYLDNNTVNGTYASLQTSVDDVEELLKNFDSTTLQTYYNNLPVFTTKEKSDM
jgi:hypothetical protein